MAPVYGLTGAAVNEGSTGASVIPSIPLNERQPLQSTSPSSESIERAQVDQHTADDLPIKSIFGPFPPSTEANDGGQQSITSIRSGEMSATAPAITTDPIVYSKGNRQTGTQSSLSPLTREKTAPAIGPATDQPTPVPKESEIEGPVLFITLLLSSTGARHPYKLDEKYLRKRNVTVEGNNPINISLYMLKELILRDWREGKH